MRWLLLLKNCTSRIGTFINPFLRRTVSYIERIFFVRTIYLASHETSCSLSYIQHMVHQSHLYTGPQRTTYSTSRSSTWHRSFITHASCTSIKVSCVTHVGQMSRGECIASKLTISHTSMNSHSHNLRSSSLNFNVAVIHQKITSTRSCIRITSANLKNLMSTTQLLLNLSLREHVGLISLRSASPTHHTHSSLPHRSGNHRKKTSRTLIR